jgi:N-acetylglucosaminyl-diphospho-decaprenol L-rhamnosyltransferase
VTDPLPVDVVVVTWNSGEMILRCLARLDPSPVAKITVVDNGSSDDTGEAVRCAYPAVDLVQLNEGRALAAAYNRGAERGSAEFVLFLNDDVLATEASIAALVATLRERSDAVAAAGRLVDPETGKTQIEYQPQPFPTLATYTATFAGLHRTAPRFDEKANVAVDQPPGACLMVRRDVFEAVSGWDEGFEFWYEDVDLARRLRDHGVVLYVPTAPFEHMGGWSAQRLNRSELVSRHYRGALLYGSKHFGTAQRVGAGLLYAAVSAGRIALSGRNRDARAAYAGVFRDAVRLAGGRRLERS